MTTEHFADMANAAVPIDGWAAVEDSIQATALMPLPPTSDPERLLRYVLQILPKYTEMEMMVTHLRLYTTSLEQDLEQASNHTRILNTEVAGEREKKQFLERYAAQVVKERNELLHHRPSKKSKSGGMSHFTWHSCCKKSAHHAADLMPSLNAFRGDRVRELMGQIKSLQDEVRNQEKLRQEVNFLLKRAQREHDSKVAADRKHIEQLEKQLVQRSILYSNMERKVYEVESALARHDTVKQDEMRGLSGEHEASVNRIHDLEASAKLLTSQYDQLTKEMIQLRDQLESTTAMKTDLIEQVEHLQTELTAAQEDAEALRGEVSVLQTDDITTIKNLYMNKIDTLQNEWVVREHELMRQVDMLRREVKDNQAVVDKMAQPSDLPPAHEHLSINRFRDSLVQDAPATWQQLDDEWRRGGTMSRHGDDAVGSSLSRSQLSESFSSNLSLSLDLENSSGGRQHYDFEPEGSSGSDYDEGFATAFDRSTRLSTDKSYSRLFHESKRATQSSHHGDLEEEEKDEYEDKNEDERETDRHLQGTDDGTIFATRAHTSHVSSEQSSAPPRDDVGYIEEELPEIHQTHHNEVNAETETSDLALDLERMLQEFEHRRTEEEEKAARAQKALIEFHETRDRYRNTPASFVT